MMRGETGAASGSALRARPVFWLMLLLAALGCAGMKLLAWKAQANVDPDLRIAVFRYTTDAMPDCEQLLGQTPDPARSLAEADGLTDAETKQSVTETLWVRLQPSPLTSTETRSGHRACRVSAPLPM